MPKRASMSGTTSALSSVSACTSRHPGRASAIPQGRRSVPAATTASAASPNPTTGCCSGAGGAVGRREPAGDEGTERDAQRLATEHGGEHAPGELAGGAGEKDDAAHQVVLGCCRVRVGWSGVWLLGPVREGVGGSVVLRGVPGADDRLRLAAARAGGLGVERHRVLASTPATTSSLMRERASSVSRPSVHELAASRRCPAPGRARTSCRPRSWHRSGARPSPRGRS